MAANLRVRELVRANGTKLAMVHRTVTMPVRTPKGPRGQRRRPVQHSFPSGRTGLWMAEASHRKAIKILKEKPKY